MDQSTHDDNLLDTLRIAHKEIEHLQAELNSARQAYHDLFENVGDSIFIINAVDYTIQEPIRMPRADSVILKKKLSGCPYIT